MNSSIAILARRAARKSKGMLVAITLLSTLGVGLLLCGTIAADDFPSAFDAQSARLNTEDLQFSTPSDRLAQSLVENLKRDQRVAVTETQPVLQERASFTFAQNDLSLTVTYLDLDAMGTLGKQAIVESAPAVENPIYLPLLYKHGSGYRMGDSFEVRLVDGSQRNFHVAGFYENPFLGSVTIGVSGLLLPHDSFIALSNSPDGPGRATLIRAKMIDLNDLDAVNTETMSAAITESNATSAEQRDTITNTINVVRSQALNGSMIASIFLRGFAIVIVVVIMVVAGFLVRTSIIRDLPAIGVQKTLGLTSAQIICSLGAGPLAAAALGVVLGTGVGYLGLPALVSLLQAQSGLPWSPTFSTDALILSLILVVGGCVVTTLISTRQIRKTEPVLALRRGFKSHNFYRNPAPLTRARGPINALLGLHQGAHSGAQNVVVLTVFALVTFTAAFSTIMGSKVLGNEDAMRHITVGESEDVTVSLQHDVDRAAFREQTRQLPNVHDAAYLEWLITSTEGKNTVTAVTDDFSVYPTTAIYEGREPLHENEVALGGKLAQELGRRIGDRVRVSVGATTQEYLITGLLSTVQYGGLRIDLTTAGYQRLSSEYQPTDLAFFLDSRTPEDAAALISTLKQQYSSNLKAVTNTQANVTSALQSYVSMSQLLGIVILCFTGFVICLTMALLVRTMTVRNQSSYGVRKALGFTSRDLIIQTVFAYLPTMFAGAISGATIGCLATPGLVTRMVSGMGVMKLDVRMDLVEVAQISAGVIALSVVLIIFTALSLRKVSAYNLFRAT